MSPSNLHSAWARLFVRALAASGVRDVVLSPGSRSTPLALAAVEEDALRCHAVVDERSAAFFALGLSRVSGQPTALVCTSGTAGAHYLPAILEASRSYVPLIVVTADRPWELVDVAAPQTLDQLKLFGDAVRHFAELGLPDASPLAMRAVPRIAAQAASDRAWPRAWAGPRQCPLSQAPRARHDGRARALVVALGRALPFAADPRVRSPHRAFARGARRDRRARATLEEGPPRVWPGRARSGGAPRACRRGAREPSGVRRARRGDEPGALWRMDDLDADVRLVRCAAADRLVS